jgi:hypothetical protein
VGPLILTPKEKRVLAFVVAAFALGLATKYYRDTYRPLSEPAPASPTQAIHKSRLPRPAPLALPDTEQAGEKQKSEDSRAYRGASQMK